MKQPDQIPSWRTRSATLCAWSVAAAFLVTGLAKAYDLYGFMEKATYYRAVPTAWMRPAALATIALELLLALLLVFRLRPRVVAWVTIAVLAGFSALVAHAWRVYGIEDCGCLGVLADTPPGASLAKNAAMVLALLWVLRNARTHPTGPRRWVGFCTASASLGAGATWMIVTQL